MDKRLIFYLNSDATLFDAVQLFIYSADVILLFDKPGRRNFTGEITKTKIMTKIQNTAGWKIILFLLAFVAIFVAAAIISDLLTGWINHPAVKVLVRELLIKIPLTLAGFYLFASRVIGVKGEDVYLTGFNRRIFLWLIGGIVITGVAFILIIFMARPGVFERIGNLPARSISYYIAATFALALSAAILEETLFRGYILGILEKKWNAAIAIVTPSVLFGLLHLVGLSRFVFSDVLMLLLGGSLAGIMFGMIAWKSRNAYAASMVHFAWNLVFSGKVIMMGLAAEDQMRGLYYVKLDPAAGMWLTGGNFGVEVSLPAILVYTTVIIVVITTGRNATRHSVVGAPGNTVVKS